MHEALTIGRGYDRAASRDISAERGFNIPSLDGIRALAVMIVFVGHAGLGYVVPGGFGVTVFFFLSGYLITTLLRREYERTGRISLRNFYLRRIYRIFPPLYLVLAILITLKLSGVIPYAMSGWAVAAQLAHLTNYYLLLFPGVEFAPVVPYTVPMWSLAVEEHFYLLFPLSLLFLLKKNTYPRAALALAAVCAVVLAWRIALLWLSQNPDHYTYHATDTRLDSLLFGCIMALWMNPAMDEPPEAIGARGWAILCFAAVVVLLGTFLYRDPSFRAAVRYTVQGIALFPLFYCAVRYARSPFFSWLNLRPVRALGIISYTVYLSHFAAIQLAGKLLGVSGFTRGVLGFAFTVAFSAACYVLIERRFAVLRRKLHRN
ncbi:MAG: acyltransferase [Betaproteobacteria bacterium]|nr:MAG: acyltransferase [Betaproteobacteria bacterium]